MAGLGGQFGEEGQIKALHQVFGGETVVQHGADIVSHR